MTLYLFKPAERWKYCGGGMAIIAANFEDCQKFTDEKLYYYETDIPAGADSFNIWTLVESFEVRAEASRLVFEDYNWG